MNVNGLLQPHNEVALSILIPTLYRRRDFLQQLMGQIYSQKSIYLDRTEVLTNADSGIKKIGTKRNELLRSANGEYIVFIDDDDEISTDYLQRLFEGIELGVDHVGICMQYRSNGIVEKVLCSKNYKWEYKGKIHWRSVQHVCAVKKHIAQQVYFPEINFGEDKEYAQRITPLVQSEHLISEPIYFYNYRANKGGI